MLLLNFTSSLGHPTSRCPLGWYSKAYSGGWASAIPAIRFLHLFWYWTSSAMFDTNDFSHMLMFLRFSSVVKLKNGLKNLMCTACNVSSACKCESGMATLWIFRVGRDSSVAITTRYGVDGQGIESACGARFFLPEQTVPEAHPASYTKGTGYLSHPHPSKRRG